MESSPRNPEMTPKPFAALAGGPRWRSALPVLSWLPHYRATWLRSDLLAGLTLAAYLLPAAIGDASLAGLPPQMGLYSCLFAGGLFWIFCSSRQTAVSVSSAISLLLGSTLGGWAGGDSARYLVLASSTAILVAGIAALAWMLQAGGIVRFISEGVMIGFKCGVALFLASTQLPKLAGFAGVHGDFWENTAHFIRHLGDTNPLALGIGVMALLVLLAGKFFLPNQPVSLAVVVAGIVTATLFPIAAQGVELLGAVPPGLPALAWPPFDWSDFNQLLPLALACFLLAAVETAAIGRMFHDRSGGRFDANQELLALSAANLASGLASGFPVSGGMSQSAVNHGAGARTPLSGLVASGCIVLVALYFSTWLQALPQPVLAAVVVVAVIGLLNVPALVRFWRTDRTEFTVAIATMLGVLGSGLLRGVLIGAVISLLMLVRRASRPHVALLGRVPGTARFSDLERHPENEPIPGVLIYRPESGLVYFNIDHVCQLIAGHACSASPRPALVVLDLSASPHVDLQSAHGLAELATDLQAEGIRIQIVEARAAVRDRLQAEGVAQQLGGIDPERELAHLLSEPLGSFLMKGTAP